MDKRFGAFTFVSLPNLIDSCTFHASFDAFFTFVSLPNLLESYTFHASFE